MVEAERFEGGTDPLQRSMASAKAAVALDMVRRAERYAAEVAMT
jgi:hypothetical protein